MTEVSLVFPHQLFDRHPALQRGRPVCLVEDPLWFGDPSHPARFHLHKLLLHRASMQEYARSLRRQNYEVFEFPYSENSTPGAVLRTLHGRGTRTLHLADPVDFLLDKRLRRAATAHDLQLVIHESPQFLTPRQWNHDFLAAHPSSIQHHYYIAQRKRLNLLLQADGKPLGGQWSFDADNRKSLPAGASVPPLPHCAPSKATRLAAADIDRDFPGHPGSTANFWFPTTRAQALRWLDDFLEHRFRLFGDYEDAIAHGHPVLFHSVLTPALNIGLLTPGEILHRALDAAKEFQVPLNSLEGFVRQLAGWREFMRAMYELHGVHARTRNFWGFTRRMPPAFYTATTGIPPVDQTIRGVLDRAWCHHIERLMILGNFMLLCRIHPDDVYRWFMELFIDAYDWVMVPNVYSMSQFADGGRFTTKPYLSGSNYIRKMSDYPAGGWCAVWDGLFWTFIEDHRDFFASQPRLSMMAKTWERMDPAKRAAHRHAAGAFLETLF